MRSSDEQTQQKTSEEGWRQKVAVKPQKYAGALSPSPAQMDTPPRAEDHSELLEKTLDVFSQAKFRKKSCKNPKFTFRKSEKNRGSFLPHEGMFHAVAFPFKQ